MTSPVALGCTLLFRKQSEAICRQYAVSGDNISDIILAITQCAKEHSPSERYIGVEDVFFVGGVFGEGVLLGFRSLDFIRSLKQAMDFRDSGTEASVGSAKWMMVRLLYWIPASTGNRSFPACIEADMAMKPSATASEFSERLSSLEYEEPFFDSLMSALALTTEQIRVARCLGVREIEPIPGDPLAGDPFFESTEPWCDTLRTKVVSPSELAERIGDILDV